MQRHQARRSLLVALVALVAFVFLAGGEPLARADAGAPPETAEPSASSAEPALTSDPDAPPPPPPPEDAARVLERLLAQKRYAFCHDAEREVGRDVRLCAYAREHAPACPAFARACEAAPPLRTTGESSGIRVPLWLAQTARVVFWVLLGLGIGYWLVRIVRHFLDGRSADEPASDVGASLPPESAAPRERVMGVVDKDAARLLTSAERALRSGDERGAARFAHAALVRALEAAGHLYVDRSSTNGDYARALGEWPELRDVFREAARQVERSEFGKEPPAQETLQALLAHITPIVHRLVTLVWLLALPLLGTSCSSGAWERLTEGAEDTPRGTSVIEALLETRGATLERRYQPLAELPEEDTDTLVVTPRAPLSAEDWDTVAGWTSDGGYLVLVGPRPDLPKQLGLAQRDGTPCRTSPVVVTLEGLTSAKVTSPVPPLTTDSTWTTVIACGDAPLVATRELEEGFVVAVADPDFLTNASLASGDHARVAMNLLGTPATVSLVDHRLAAGATSPYRAIAASGLLPTLAQGLLALLLWVLASGMSFGTPRDPREPGRRAFAEHVRAVGSLYAKRSASRHALGSYAAWAIERLGTRLRPGGSVRVLDLGSTIARITGRKESAIAALLAEAADARDRPGDPGTTEDLVLLAELDDIVHETGGHK